MTLPASGVLNRSCAKSLNDAVLRGLSNVKDAVGRFDISGMSPLDSLVVKLGAGVATGLERGSSNP